MISVCSIKRSFSMPSHYSERRLSTSSASSSGRNSLRCGVMTNAPALSLFLVVAVLFSIGVSSAAEPATPSGTAFPIALSADRAASQPDTSFALIELENNESSVVAQHLRARYSHVPNIEELTLWNMQEILGAYLEQHEKRMIARQTYKDESDDIYFTFFVGDIVHVAHETVQVKNPALSDIVGEELEWNAVFFIPRFGTRQPEDYNVVFPNHEGRPTGELV